MLVVFEVLSTFPHPLAGCSQVIGVDVPNTPPDTQSASGRSKFAALSQTGTCGENDEVVTCQPAGLTSGCMSSHVPSARRCAIAGTVPAGPGSGVGKIKVTG